MIFSATDLKLWMNDPIFICILPVRDITFVVLQASLDLYVNTVTHIFSLYKWLFHIIRQTVVNLGPRHTISFLFENAFFLTCFRQSSILRRLNTLRSTGTFERGFKSRVFWKRTVLKRSFLTWTGGSGASVHLQVYLDCSVVWHERHFTSCM